jgi:trk system potassium uptake protein TrkA
MKVKAKLSQAKTKILLIGGFRKTKILAKSLLQKGYKVSVINSNYENCLSLSEIDGLKVFHGDGTLPSVLSDADAAKCKIAIALTSNDEDNLVACQLCKKNFGVEKTIAIVGNPNKTDFFIKMGVDSAICAIDKVRSIIEQQATVDKIANSIAIGEGKVNITEIAVEENSHVVDKMLKELNLPKDIIIGCILRGDKTMIPRGETTILAGDVLITIAETGATERFLDMLSEAD